MLIRDLGSFHLKAQGFLTGLRLFQPGGVILMLVVVFLQLIVGGNQRTAVLLHSTVLLGELLPQHGEFRFGSSDSFLKVLYASPSQTEGGLGFLDLRIDGAHIAREIAGVQRKRDYQFAQGFGHEISPSFPLWFLDGGNIIEMRSKSAR